MIIDNNSLTKSDVSCKLYGSIKSCSVNTGWCVLCNWVRDRERDGGSESYSETTHWRILLIGGWLSSRLADLIYWPCTSSVWVITSPVCVVPLISTSSDAPSHRTSAGCIFRGWNCEAACQKADVHLASRGRAGHTKAWTWASHWRIEKTSASFTLRRLSVCFLKSCSVIERGWKGKVRACPGHRKHENLSMCWEPCSCFSPDTLDLLHGDFSHSSPCLPVPSSLTHNLLTHVKLWLSKHMFMFP